MEEDMKEKNNFTNGLIVMLVTQWILTSLALLYAFCGTYENNKPSNVWAAIGANGLLPAMLFCGIGYIVIGVIGIIRNGGSKSRIVLSVLLLLSVLAGAVSFILAVGSHM